MVPKAIMKGYPQVLISEPTANRPTYGALEGGDQWRTNEYQTNKEIILQGMGWGYLPEHLIKDELAQGLLKRIKIEGELEPRNIEFRIARLESEPVGPVAQKLWDLFREGSHV